MAQDPYKYFRIEARELVEHLGQALLDLEKGEHERELIAKLLRFAHTLKGAARVVKQREIAEDAHAIEDVLAPFRTTDAAPPRASVDDVLRIVDRIASRVVALDEPAPTPVTAARAARAETNARPARAEVAELDELLERATEVHARLRAIGHGAGTLTHARRLVELLANALPGPLPGPLNRGGAKSTAALEQATALAAELSTSLESLDRRLGDGLERADREIRELKSATERIRLVPMASSFTALERTARDSGLALGKRVKFEGQGGEIRLDAEVVGAIQGALVQLTRNAVVHGLESEAERTAAGKPAVGCVTVQVARRGQRVVVTCSDDGRGFDLVAVRAAAQSRGLVAPDARDAPLDEWVALLLRGGISTSFQVTEMSGRGIGLDVVREVVERLGGEIAVRNVAGRGASIDLVVPVSLSSFQALAVESNGMAVSIPIDRVRRSARIAAQEIARTGQGDAILHAGESIVFVPLATLLAQGAHATRAGRTSVVVIEGAGGFAAIGVDRLLGTIDLVLHGLPALAPAAAVVAGVSFDVDGVPRIVLDPDALVDAARRAVSSPASVKAARLPILIVDDSVTTRMLEQSILESAGYDVELATSGEDGLMKAKRSRHALFLVDVEMPGIDGFTFVERTLADAALRDTPSILVTSRAAPEDLARGRLCGAAGYVVKGEFDQSALLERIRQLVG